MGRKLTNNPFYKLLYLLFFLSIVVPIFFTFGKAIFFDDNLVSNLKQLNSQLFYLLGKSLLIATSIAILATLLGTLLGFILYKTKNTFSSFFKIALLIPLFISPYILAVAWKDFFYVYVNSYSLSQSYWGVILVLTTIYTPLSMLIIGSSLATINSQLEESGLMVTNRYAVMRKIVLPLIKPALISSFVLVFIFSVSEFTVPALFGVSVFTTEIFIQFSAFYNHSLAILQSFFLVVICLLLLYTDRKQLTNAVFFAIGDKGVKNHFYELNNKRHLANLLLFFWLFISVILPLLMLFLQAFKEDSSFFVKAFKLLVPTFVNSIGLALLGTIISVIIGFAVAYQTNKRINKTLSFDWFLLFVFAIPSGVLGISLIQFYNQSGLEIIYSSMAIIIIAYVGKFTFISSKLLSNALKQIPDSMEEIAQIQGITPYKRIQKIVLPLVSPSLFVAFIISFIFSFGELATTIMLYPPGLEIMPIKIYTIMANAPQALTSSMVLIMFILTLLLIMIFYLMLKLIVKLNRY